MDNPTHEDEQEIETEGLLANHPSAETEGHVAPTTTVASNETPATERTQTAAQTAAEARERRMERLRMPEKWCQSVLSVVRPVLLTMVITLTMLKLLETDATGSTPRTSYEEDEEGSDSERLQSAFINAGIVILIMFVSLIAIAVFYRLGWVRAILGYMMVSTFILFGMLGSIWLYELCWNLRIPLDWLTFTFCIVNFSVGGVLALFSYCPPYVTRAYLIITSSMVAWWLAFLPEWTTFALLILLIIFDIAVVLAPKGPLRVIVETAQQRREPLPAPVYHGHDIQLGLGDFIFYTVLVARGALAPSGGFLLSAAVVCLSIISGLGITLMVLAVTGRALPALPVSLFLGLIWYFFAVYLIAPFSVDLVVHQITM